MRVISQRPGKLLLRLANDLAQNPHGVNQARGPPPLWLRSVFAQLSMLDFHRIYGNDIRIYIQAETFRTIPQLESAGRAIAREASAALHTLSQHLASLPGKDPGCLTWPRVSARPAPARTVVR